MSIERIGRVKRVARLDNCIEIDASFHDQDRVFYVMPTIASIGTHVRIIMVAGVVGPVETWTGSGPVVKLSSPMDRPPTGAPRDETSGPVVIQSSPVHVTVARPGVPTFGTPPSACCMQTMNTMLIEAGLQDLLDKAGVSGENRNRYRDLAERLWRTMDAKVPEKEAELNSLPQEVVGHETSVGLDGELSGRIAGLVADVRRRCRTVMEE